MKTAEIQNTICKYLAEKGHESLCENFSYYWEMDVASLSRRGMLHEFEVKISRSDFLAEIKRKGRKFTYYELPDTRVAPNYFYYVCPPDLISKIEIPVWAGLYNYIDGEITIVKKAIRIHNVPVDKDRVLTKMLRLTIQRKYLGGSMLTFLNRQIKERNKERLNVKSELK